jgi:hypothetical protein
MSNQYSYFEITEKRNNFREVIRIHGNYLVSNKIGQFPIVLFQSLLEPWRFVLHIEFGFDATSQYSNLSPHKVRNPNTGHVYFDGTSYGSFKSFAENIISYELFFENRSIDREKAFRLLYYVFRNHLFFGEKFNKSKLLLDE